MLRQRLKYAWSRVIPGIRARLRWVFGCQDFLSGGFLPLFLLLTMVFLPVKGGEPL